ncbi:MAG: response regulator [Methylobacteriaceae bacterium]|nr:response regulator [Methylobacteriaceae bacterium]MBV9243479.1 response regulator [Methylobacteriaceae bacterium]
MRLLLAEDNRDLAGWLARLLRQSNYVVDCVYDGEAADAALRVQTYALVILDLALPRLGGLEVLKRLRRRDATTPVLILTANDAVSSRISGLDGGADDYLVKPFDVDELEARVRAQLRRGTNQKAPVVALGPLALDTNSREFRLGGAVLALTPREHAVLETLILRANKATAKTLLAESVFGFDDDANPAAIEIYVHRLRKKLDGSGVEIVTLRGLGYVLRADDAG